MSRLAFSYFHLQITPDQILHRGLVLVFLRYFDSYYLCMFYLKQQKGLVKHFKEEENSMMSSINRWLAQKGMTQSLGNGSDKNVRKFTFGAKSLPRVDLF